MADYSWTYSRCRAHFDRGTKKNKEKYRQIENDFSILNVCGMGDWGPIPDFSQYARSLTGMVSDF